MGFFECRCRIAARTHSDFGGHESDRQELTSLYMDKKHILMVKTGLLGNHEKTINLSFLSQGSSPLEQLAGMPYIHFETNCLKVYLLAQRRRFSSGLPAGLHFALRPRATRNSARPARTSPDCPCDMKTRSLRPLPKKITQLGATSHRMLSSTLCVFLHKSYAPADTNTHTRETDALMNFVHSNSVDMLAQAHNCLKAPPSNFSTGGDEAMCCSAVDERPPKNARCEMAEDIEAEFLQVRHHFLLLVTLPSIPRSPPPSLRNCISARLFLDILLYRLLRHIHTPYKKNNQANLDASFRSSNSMNSR